MFGLIILGMRYGVEIDKSRLNHGDMPGYILILL